MVHAADRLLRVGAIATGLLNADRRFAAPMYAPILNNLIVVATFLTFAAMSGPAPARTRLATGAQQLVLGIGTTLGVVGNDRRPLAIAAPHRIPVRVASPRTGRGGLADRPSRGWVVVYVAANQIGYLIVLILAAETQGGYTAYGAAFLLFQLPHAIFTVSIVTALLPAMSSRWADGDIPGSVRSSRGYPRDGDHRRACRTRLPGDRPRHRASAPRARSDRRGER